MTEPERENRWSDHQVEQFVGNLLRYGVLLAASVALLGGVVYLARHGSEPADYRVFRGQPAELTRAAGVIRAAAALNARAVIQLGILLLIATPIARVVFTLFAFARQRDRAYVGITMIVLAVLLYSLFAGH